MEMPNKMPRMMVHRLRGRMMVVVVLSWDRMMVLQYSSTRVEEVFTVVMRVRGQLAGGRRCQGQGCRRWSMALFAVCMVWIWMRLSV